jgi:hypothetical protein
VVAVALAAYLITTVGIPMPTYVNKFAGVPFPCQHHACGCATAKQCWDHCCCYSPEQKLAWAHENHVDPPARLVAEVMAAIEHGAGLATNAPRASTGCCAKRKSATAVLSVAQHDHDHHAAEHLADHDVDHVADHCDEHDYCDVAVNPASPSCHEHDAPALELTLVLGVMARHCRGLADSWCVSGAALPLPPVVRWQFSWNLVECLALASAPLPTEILSPPVPPPRV